LLKPRVLGRGKEAPLRVNPEPLALSDPTEPAEVSGRRQAQTFRPGSRRVDSKNVGTFSNRDGRETMRSRGQCPCFSK